jgi:hypothetical protein
MEKAWENDKQIASGFSTCNVYRMANAKVNIIIFTLVHLMMDKNWWI